jgi:hypothetical protein
MITFTIQAGKPFCITELRGRVGVYLDNHSIIRLAKPYEPLRQRFVSFLNARGTLLFSLTNAIEIAGPQQASADAIRDFLNSIGRHWVPLELNPYEVVRKEDAGLIDRAPVSSQFMEGYVESRINDLSLDKQSIVEAPQEFFRLGAVLDWAQGNRQQFRGMAMKLDEELRNFLIEARRIYEEDPVSLDRAYPPVSFDPLRPAAFALNHLMRLLVKEAKAFQFDGGDGLDLCHAVLGSAYGSVATLDKKWKQRIKKLPTPNDLATIYYGPELGSLVDRLESFVPIGKGAAVG